MTHSFAAGTLRACGTAALLLGLNLATQASTIPLYTAVSVPPLKSFPGEGPLAIHGSAINANGQITGASSLASDHEDSDAFLYSGGKTIALGSLGGTGISGLAINDKGEVVGEANTGGQLSQLDPFLYRNGQMIDLGAPGKGYSINSAVAINNSGQIVVSSYDLTVKQYHSFLYSDGQKLDIGSLGRDGTQADGINAQGQITGASTERAGVSYHAFLYTDSQMQDLGTLGGSYSAGFAVNASGQVTGTSDKAGDDFRDAFLYTDGRMKDLGSLDSHFASYGQAINASGEVVGDSLVPGVIESHAFLYANDQMYDLNNLVTSGIRPDDFLEGAYGINDKGWIVANGANSAYLLEPVPEPASLVLFALGCLVLGGAALRRSAVSRRLSGITALDPVHYKQDCPELQL